MTMSAAIRYAELPKCGWPKGGSRLVPPYRLHRWQRPHLRCWERYEPLEPELEVILAKLDRPSQRHAAIRLYKMKNDPVREYRERSAGLGLIPDETGHRLPEPDPYPVTVEDALKWWRTTRWAKREQEQERRARL